MVLEHEIPHGSKLYFGQSAKLKRDIEEKASKLLGESGFEEIVTPLFSYLQQHNLQDDKGVLKLSNETNHQIILRSDSTPDITRIITNRLGRSTSHKKWFYIQPVFQYPTEEIYQIGAEHLGSTDSAAILKMGIDLFRLLGLSPLLQLSNIQIPKLCAEELGISLDILKSTNIEQLETIQAPWLHTLLYSEDAEGLKKAKAQTPHHIAQEIDKLLELAASLNYERLVFAPLYYAKMEYYDGIYFRMIENNDTLMTGGNYATGSMESCGLAFYTDTLIDLLLKKDIH